MSGPMPFWCAPVTIPLSWIYAFLIRRRNARFDQPDATVDVQRPVISVGNITAGGTGKSPMVHWICNVLRDAGYAPLIAMRGYGARDGEHGDEELVYNTLLPDVPVAAGADRVATIRRALGRDTTRDVIVLDDGFQHRRVRRDLDIVLIDATRNTMKDRVLPAGWLREPLAGLERADAVIVTRSNEPDSEVVEDLANTIERHHRQPALGRTDHTWSHLEHIGSGNEPVSWLQGKRVVTMLGIGNPKSVQERLEAHGAVVKDSVPVRDHARYDDARVRTVRGLCQGADAFVITLKDWVKLRDLITEPQQWPCPIIVPHLAMAFHDDGAALRALVLDTAAGLRSTVRNARINT